MCGWVGGMCGGWWRRSGSALCTGRLRPRQACDGRRPACRSASQTAPSPPRSLQLQAPRVPRTLTLMPWPPGCGSLWRWPGRVWRGRRCPATVARAAAGAQAAWSWTRRALRRSWRGCWGSAQVHLGLACMWWDEIGAGVGFGRVTRGLLLVRCVCDAAAWSQQLQLATRRALLAGVKRAMLDAAKMEAEAKYRHQCCRHQ